MPKRQPCIISVFAVVQNLGSNWCSFFKDKLFGCFFFNYECARCHTPVVLRRDCLTAPLGRPEHSGHHSGPPHRAVPRQGVAFHSSIPPNTPWLWLFGFIFLLTNVANLITYKLSCFSLVQGTAFCDTPCQILKKNRRALLSQFLCEARSFCCSSENWSADEIANGLRCTPPCGWIVIGVYVVSAHAPGPRNFGKMLHCTALLFPPKLTKLFLLLLFSVLFSFHLFCSPGLQHIHCQCQWLWVWLGIRLIDSFHLSLVRLDTPRLTRWGVGVQKWPGGLGPLAPTSRGGVCRWWVWRPKAGPEKANGFQLSSLLCLGEKKLCVG